jgi:uncharacterized iron-regulated membrane protein
VHSIAGLFSALFIFLLSLSGALLVFHEELDAFQKPNTGLTKNGIALLSIDSCYKKVRINYPGAMISSFEIAHTNTRPHSFILYDSSFENGTKPMQVFMDPVLGNIIGKRSGSGDVKNNIMGWLSGFHNSFHQGKKGEWLLGVFALFFLLSIITGIFLYRKNVPAVLLFRKSIYKKNSLHQLIGTWTLLFNLMIGLTGFWMQRYVFKKEFYHTYDFKTVVKASPPIYFNFNKAYDKVKQQYPGFTASVIYFAQSKNGVTAIYGSNKSNSFIYSKKLTDVIYLDSAGLISKTRLINEIGAADRFDIVNAQLHFGKYGGIPLKIIYCLFGLATAVLSISGFVQWYKRKRLV